MSSALAMSDSFIIRHKSQQTVVFLWNMASGRAVWGSWRPAPILITLSGVVYIMESRWPVIHQAFQLADTHVHQAASTLPKLELSGTMHKTHLWEMQVKSLLLPFHHTSPLSLLRHTCEGWDLWGAIISRLSFEGAPKDFDGFDSSHLWLWQQTGRC